MRSDPVPRVFMSERNDPEDSFPIKICWLVTDKQRQIGMQAYRQIDRCKEADKICVKFEAKIQLNC